jgi:hypothetical protein
MGYHSLFANTTGTQNVAVGALALDANTTSDHSTAVGYGALTDQSSGNGRNTAMGYLALENLTSGDSNVGVGYLVGSQLTTGDANVFIGGGEYGLTNPAGYAVTTGNANTFIGHSAGSTVTTGSNNTILGSYDGNQGGLDIRTASNHIVLSDGDGNPRGIFDASGDLLVGTTTNSDTSGEGFKFKPDGEGTNKPRLSITTVGYQTETCLSIYSTAVTAFRFYVDAAGTISAVNTTISSLSDERVKENVRDLDDGLDKILQLQPRKFDWKEGQGRDISNDRGFIAQEFEQVFPDMIEEWKDKAPEGEEPYKAINANLIPTLVKAIQEQQVLIESLTARIEALEGAN